jgi:polysaccharide biosynthesis/export protein
MRRANFIGIGWEPVHNERCNEEFLKARVTLLMALLLTVTPALAQNSPGKDSHSVSTQLDINQRLQQANEKLEASSIHDPAAESLIGPDDLLNISIFEAPEMNCSVRVTAGGEISVPLVGVVHAAGLTPRELESALQDRLRGTYMKDPHVSVFVQELQSHAVSVVGAVKMPGVFQIRGTKTLIEVLSMAQGLTDDAGAEVIVMHGAEYPPSAGSPRPDPVPTGPPVSEFPEVFPSAYDAPRAGPGKKMEMVTINLKSLLESQQSNLNVPVRPGDILKVPRAGIVYVVGEVAKPGGFVLQNNESISMLQALALAQGTTHTSALGRARIIRTDPATGTQTEIPANLSKIISGKSADPFLQPRDVVFVPNSSTKSVLYRTSAAALQTAAGVAIYKW